MRLPEVLQHAFRPTAGLRHRPMLSRGLDRSLGVMELLAKGGDQRCVWLAAGSVAAASFSRIPFLLNTLLRLWSKAATFGQLGGRCVWWPVVAGSSQVVGG